MEVAAAAPAVRWSVQPQHHHHSTLPSSSRKTIFLQLHPRFAQFRGLGAVSGRRRSRSSEVYALPWDDKPFEILPRGKRAYLDEQDVVTFLDPPKDLIPLDPASYNPAAYL